MGVKVSVVIPVYNPGPYLETCLTSVLHQTLPPSEYEVLFIDDGSTDGSTQRLQTVVEQHPHIRLIHAARTGGPGRPRNIGIEAAKGEYVYFLDPDDRLTPRALERMYDMAVRNSADIVIGKVVGHGGRGVPSRLFRESKDSADLIKDNLFGLLTPHKLFRTAFLLRHRLRFPEGPVWLEDHRFVVEAFFLAKKISVLADEVCCHWVKQRGRAHYSARRFDPVKYYKALRAVLDVVDAYTIPGDDRDQLYAHWYHGKMLRLLGGQTFLNRFIRPRRYIQAREIRKLAKERFAPSVEQWLPVSMRVRARLLHAGAYADISRLARAERGLTVVPFLDRVDWDGNQLVVRVTGRLTYADGRPVRFQRNDGRLLWEPPVQLRTPLPDDAFDVTKVIEESRLDIYVRDRQDGGDFAIPTTSHLVPEGSGGLEQLVLQGTARIDVRSGKLGRPLDPGIWDLFVRMETCGWVVQRRLSRPTSVQIQAPQPKRVLGADGTLLVEPYWTALGKLSLRVSVEPPD